MVNIGDQLLEPEEGMQRIDDTNDLIVYDSNFTGQTISLTDAHYYKQTRHISNVSDSSVTFYVYTSNFYLIGITNDNGSCSNSNDVFINDVLNNNFSESDVVNEEVVVYLKKFEKKNFFKITIINRTSLYLHIDAIDIDDDGFILGEDTFNACNALNVKTSEVLFSNNFPVKVAGDTIVDENSVKTYAASVINGQKQLLLRKNGEMYLTNGDGTYKKISKQYLNEIENVPNKVIQNPFKVDETKSKYLVSVNNLDIVTNYSSEAYFFLNNPLGKNKVYYFEVKFVSGNWGTTGFSMLINSTRYNVEDQGWIRSWFPSIYFSLPSNKIFGVKIDRINGKFYFTNDGSTFYPNEGVNFDNNYDDVFIGFANGKTTSQLHVSLILEEKNFTLGLPSDSIGLISRASTVNRELFCNDSLIKKINTTFEEGQENFEKSLKVYNFTKRQLFIFNDGTQCITNGDGTYTKINSEQFENKDVISKLSEDLSGNLLYNGKSISVTEKKLVSLSTFGKVQ